MKNVILVTVLAALIYFVSMYIIDVRNDDAFRIECEKNNGTYDSKMKVCDLGTEELDLPATTTAPTAQQHIDSKKDLIVTESVQMGAMISSPLVLTGKARGYWYFEASFPVTVLNAQNVIIGGGIAQAQGDWMTEDFVPFMANVTFTPQPAGSTGTLMLSKDNPSGLPENDDALLIPVTF